MRSGREFSHILALALPNHDRPSLRVSLPKHLVDSQQIVQQQLWREELVPFDHSTLDNLRNTRCNGVFFTNYNAAPISALATQQATEPYDRLAFSCRARNARAADKDVRQRRPADQRRYDPEEG